MSQKTTTNARLNPAVAWAVIETLRLSDSDAAERFGIGERYWRYVRNGREPSDDFIKTVTMAVHGIRTSQIPLVWSAEGKVAREYFTRARSHELPAVEQHLDALAEQHPDKPDVLHVLASTVFAQQKDFNNSTRPVQRYEKAERIWNEAKAVALSAAPHALAAKVFDNNALSMRYFIDSRYKGALTTPTAFKAYRDQYRAFALEIGWVKAWLDTLEMSGQMDNADLIAEDFAGFLAAFESYGAQAKKASSVYAVHTQILAMDGSAPRNIIKQPAYLSWLSQSNIFEES